MIAFQDDWILVANKPAGLPSQRTAIGEEGLYEQLCETHPYVGLHHRLDRNASGLLLFTLDRSVNKAISQAFKTHQIQRTYLAWLEGEAQSATWRWPVQGKSATTHMTLRAYAGGVSEVSCELETGRLHQIRVHAAMNGTPVLGDRKYGGDAVRPAPRLGLHAWKLRFIHPHLGTPQEVESPRPDL